MLHSRALEVLARDLARVRGVDLVVPGTLVPPLELMRARGLPYAFIAELHARLESSANPHVVSYEVYLASKDEMYARMTSVIVLLTIAQLEAVRSVYEMLLAERRASDAGVPGARKKSAVTFDLQAVEWFYLRAREFYRLYDGPRVPEVDYDGFLVLN